MTIRRSSASRPSRCGRTRRPASRAVPGGRPFALSAEILGRLDEAGAEEHLPEAIDRHAGRQRVARVDQPARRAEPVGRRRRLGRRTAGGAGTPGSTSRRGWSYSPRMQHDASAAASASPPSPSSSGSSRPASAARAAKSSQCAGARAESPAARRSPGSTRLVRLLGCACGGLRSWPIDPASHEQLHPAESDVAEDADVGDQAAEADPARRRRRCAAAPCWRKSGSIRRAAPSSARPGRRCRCDTPSQHASRRRSRRRDATRRASTSAPSRRAGRRRASAWSSSTRTGHRPAARRSRPPAASSGIRETIAPILHICWPNARGEREFVVEAEVADVAGIDKALPSNLHAASGPPPADCAIRPPVPLVAADQRFHPRRLRPCATAAPDEPHLATLPATISALPARRAGCCCSRVGEP